MPTCQGRWCVICVTSTADKRTCGPCTCQDVDDSVSHLRFIIPPKTALLSTSNIWALQCILPSGLLRHESSAPYLRAKLSGSQAGCC